MKAGDVVFIEGASAILGDVLWVDPDPASNDVRVRWRSVETTEDVDELVLADPTKEEGA